MTETQKLIAEVRDLRYRVDNLIYFLEHGDTEKRIQDAQEMLQEMKEQRIKSGADLK